jgi:hypothetical protein
MISVKSLLLFYCKYGLLSNFLIYNTFLRTFDNTFLIEEKNGIQYPNFILPLRAYLLSQPCFIGTLAIPSFLALLVHENRTAAMMGTLANLP